MTSHLHLLWLTVLAPAVLCSDALAGTKKFWHEAYDVDGDGYADEAHASDYDWIEVPADELLLWVPDGYVSKCGDLDDDDPDVHPRRREILGNGVDDDCDGRIDEAEPVYYPSGNGNWDYGFLMEVDVNDSSILQVYEDSTVESWLCYDVEYQNLRKTGVTRHTGVSRVEDMEVWPSSAWVTFEVDVPHRGTVYRARVQFYERHREYGSIVTTPVGEASDWYYTTTYYPNALGQARTAILLTGFYEYYLSEELGYVGYRGFTYEDGSRYGPAGEVELDEAWCSEFYSWTTSWELPDMGHRANVSSVQDFFGSDLVTVTDPVDLIDDAHRGDYLALNGTQHSCMFLAYDLSTGNLWTLDGNSSNLAADGDRRNGGNEVAVRERDVDAVTSFGALKVHMLD